MYASNKPVIPKIYQKITQLLRPWFYLLMGVFLEEESRKGKLNTKKGLEKGKRWANEVRGIKLYVNTINKQSIVKYSGRLNKSRCLSCANFN